MKLRSIRDITTYALELVNQSVIIPENVMIHVELETPLFEKFIIDRKLSKSIIDLDNIILTTKGIRFYLKRKNDEF